MFLTKIEDQKDICSWDQRLCKTDKNSRASACGSCMQYVNVSPDLCKLTRASGYNVKYQSKEQSSHTKVTIYKRDASQYHGLLRDENSRLTWSLETRRSSLLENSGTTLTELTHQQSKKIKFSGNIQGLHTNFNWCSSIRTLNKGFRFFWMALWNLVFKRLGSQSYDPGFDTISTTNCSGPPWLGLTLTAAVSNTLLSALLHTRTISSELVYESEILV